MKLFGKNKQTNTQAVPVPGSVKNFERGMNSVTDIIAPSSIEVDFGHIRVGENFHKILLNIQ